MFRHSRIAALAATIMITAPADAALVYQYDFFSVGSGVQVSGINSGNVRSTSFANGLYQLFLPANGGTYDIFSDGFGRALIGGGFNVTSNGVRFGQALTNLGRGAEVRGSAFACFANSNTSLPPQAGVFQADQSCSSASYFQTDGQTSSVTYSGTIESLTISLVDLPVDNAYFTFVAGVPEPSTWALMLAGFGMVGYSLRRRRVRHQAVTVAA